MSRFSFDTIVRCEKKNDNVKLTTRFLSGKMHMFAKLSLMSFIYELVETVYFPDEIVKKIYERYLIEKVYIYHVLTDTDSSCLKFIFVSSTDSDISDKKFRDIIFEVIVVSKIYNMLDSSNIYWEKFMARKEKLLECLGNVEIEHVDNPCFVTVAVNPKEYYKSFEDNSLNKKHKGIKKGSSGMDFENYPSRILLVNDCDFLKKPDNDVKKCQG